MRIIRLFAIGGKVAFSYDDKALIESDFPDAMGDILDLEESGEPGAWTISSINNGEDVIIAIKGV